MNGTLVKWDAAVCTEEVLPIWKRAVRRIARLFGKNVYEPRTFTPPVENAVGHPGCIEVLALKEGQLPEVVYRRPA
jgi:hypothetical protein